MEGPPEWKRWGRGSPAGRRVRAFEGWGLVVPQEEWGGGALQRQQSGERRTGVDGLGFNGKWGRQG